MAVEARRLKKQLIQFAAQREGQASQMTHLECHFVHFAFISVTFVCLCSNCMCFVFILRHFVVVYMSLSLHVSVVISVSIWHWIYLATGNTVTSTGVRAPDCLALFVSLHRPLIRVPNLPLGIQHDYITIIFCSTSVT